MGERNKASLIMRRLTKPSRLESLVLSQNARSTKNIQPVYLGQKHTTHRLRVVDLRFALWKKIRGAPGENFARKNCSRARLLLEDYHAENFSIAAVLLPCLEIFGSKSLKNIELSRQKICPAVHFTKNLAQVSFDPELCTSFVVLIYLRSNVVRQITPVFLYFKPNWMYIHTYKRLIRVIFKRWLHVLKSIGQKI